MAKLVGRVMIVWGTTMAALAIATLVFLVLGGGNWGRIPYTGLNLVLGLGACYVGFVLWRRKPKQEE